ncbi:hypothetical protein SAMN05216559_1971 [Halomicrobium zhouii]|uniref:Uncharacterized protein n=1 Tax=Halomicrobium zhouii TaxID=767519 RepID=A0A1I6L4C5_9EURY|nr:hypothetical protein [Halomicrobium zhouii]SFR98100.1 hypothetical protein SAMN05216559_1971 [Halomicrobium zhouii]
MNRRHVLALLGSTLSIAGCTSRETSSPNSTSMDTPETTTENQSTASPTVSLTESKTGLPFETPSPKECTVSDLPRPEPTAGLQTKDYPQYPQSVTAASAEAYATDFEAVYQFNSYLDTEANSDTQELSVDPRADNDLSEETTDGFLVGVEGELSVQQGALYDNPVTGVYHLTTEMAVRADIEAPTLYDVGSLRSVSVTGTQTIYCRDSSSE